MMYSQYTYYQNNFPATPSHQLQQPLQQANTTTTATSGQVWNGQQWVATAAAAPVAPSYAQVVAPAPPPPIIKHGKTHLELVQLYTTYYHRWHDQAVSSKATLTALPPPHPNTPSNNARREEMERREKWASYYSSNSAALAHYHLALSKSNDGAGGGVEPYARPASPPAPPQVTDAKAVKAADAILGSDAAKTVSLDTTEAVPTSATEPSGAATEVGKKKSRWGGQKENDHGKSSSAAAGDASTETSTAPTAADEKKNASKNDHNNLYLKKFVQETSSLEKLEESTLLSRKSNNTEQPSASATSAKSKGGKKRKLTRRESSSLSHSLSNDSYYGPQSSQVQNTGTSSATWRKEEDDTPLALNQALASSPKKAKKQKKKEAKKNPLASSKGPSGFDANKMVLSERASRFKGKGGIYDAASTVSTTKNVEKYMGKTTIGGSKKHLDENDYERMTVKGTCQTLEKDYFRLTSPPSASQVRPQNILEQHLSNLKHSYYHCGKIHDGRARDYNWYCSQFKALRQDLTVQRLMNRFSVDVYETHAKVALEEDDINEYNQSQTQLKELYESIDAGVGGGKHMQQQHAMKEKEEALKNRNEFIAYRIIYYVFLSGNRKYEGGSSDIFKIMLQLAPEQRKDECIHHALLVRAAVADNDYHKFFQLQDSAPNMSDYLMDKIVPSVRRDALQRICRAYRPSVSAKFVLKELGFDVQNKEEVKGGKTWMESCGCVFEGELLMTKDTVLKENSSVGVKNSLI